MNEFEIKVSFIKIELIIIPIAIVVDSSLYINLLFGLTIGLFSVSAGLYLYM